MGSGKSSTGSHLHARPMPRAAVPAAVPEDIVGLASRQVAGKLCVWSSRRRARDLCVVPWWLICCARGSAGGGVREILCRIIHPLNCTVVCVEYGTIVSCNFLVAPRLRVSRESVCGLCGCGPVRCAPLSALSLAPVRTPQRTRVARRRAQRPHSLSLCSLSERGTTKALSNVKTRARGAG